jgi:hypothetical protein
MLRERTLQHLLLSVAKSLEEVPANFKHRKILSDSCETLQIVREHRGPYLVTVSNELGQTATEVETSRFRFHERGDVAIQIKSRGDLPDARTHNWEQALILWQEILGIEFERTRGLAPMRKVHGKTDGMELFIIGGVSIALLTVEKITSLTWPVVAILAWLIPLTKPKKVHLGLALLLVISSTLNSGYETFAFGPLLMVAMFQFESLIRSKFDVLGPIAGTVLAAIMCPDQLPIVLLILAFEVIVSFVQLNYFRISILTICMTVVIVISINYHQIVLTENHNGWITAPLAFILLVTLFPRASESNLIRISAPLGLMVGTIYFNLEIASSVALLLIWLLRCADFPTIKKPNQSGLQPSGVPVTISKRDSAS